MKRAVRFDHQDTTRQMADSDTTQSHAVNFMRSYQNLSITENDAVGYRTTLHPLLDLNFMVSSLRNRNEEFIVDAFIKAYADDPKYTVKWLFFLRDILEGLGERRSFRICMHHLAIAKPKTALAVMDLIPEYGRFDDLLCLLDTPIQKEVCTFLKKQLDQDLVNMEEEKPISLLAKWLPSINTSSYRTREVAEKLAKKFKMTPSQYRKTLSKLRAYSNVLEVTITEAKWSEVDYSRVPAKANLKYDNAFFRHDEKRRGEYLLDTLNNQRKINGKGLMPYEIVHNLMKNAEGESLRDNLLSELLWKQIVENGFQNDWGFDDCIVVADGSGSMFRNMSGNTKVRAIDVCNSLAIYFAQQLKGDFHNKAISFSGRPEFIDLSGGKSLRDKLEIMFAYDEVANTNIEAVFDMILDMSVSRKVPKEEIPKQVLIISDMEFDEASKPEWYSNKTSWHRFDQTLFEHMEAKYQAAGYKMPRLIFWNVCGRTDTIPKVEHEQGICLLSGFSQNAMKVATNTEILDPYESLIKTLDAPRYDRVEEALSE